MSIDPETIGFIAAVITTAAYVPQVIKVARTRDTKSISLGMFALITTGIGIWCVYGIMVESPSLIFANGLCFLMAGYILLMKLRCG